MRWFGVSEDQNQIEKVQWAKGARKNKVKIQYWRRL